jgi:predicted nucleic acid-binding protein
VKYVLDADVLIGALDGNDPHHPTARQLFTTWQAQRHDLAISIINLTEVLIAPAGDPQRLHLARSAITALRIEINPPTEAIGIDAARLRARHPISLPDAYMLATTRHLRATAASFDRKVLRAAKAENITALP